MQDNSRLTLEQLNELVAARNLAPAKLMTVGQLRIATVPSEERIAAGRNRLPISDAQLAEFMKPLPVGQQRIAVMPSARVHDTPQIDPANLSQWGATIIGHPDGSTSCINH